MTFREVLDLIRNTWRRARVTGNIQEIHQLILLFAMAIGTALASIRILRAIGWAIGNLFYYSVAFISPELKFDINNTLKEYKIPKILLIGALLGLVVSLGYPAFFSWWSNTLFSDPSMTPARRIGFLNDIHNLQIYTLISPAYLALSSAIIITALRGWLLIPKEGFEHEENKVFFVLFGRTLPRQIANAIGMLLFISLIPILVNVNQSQSILALDVQKEGLFWFVDRSGDGTVHLNKAGVAYSIVNSIKFMVILAAAVCFFASTAELMHLAGRIPEIRKTNESIDFWREHLRHYAILELLSKCLIVILALHTSIFSKQPWQPHSNAVLQVLAIIIVGIAIVPFPRFYFEYRWLMDERERGPAQTWPDVRPNDLRIFFLITSTVLYGSGTFLAFWFDLRVDFMSPVINIFKRG